MKILYSNIYVNVAYQFKNIIKNFYTKHKSIDLFLHCGASIWKGKIFVHLAIKIFVHENKSSKFPWKLVTEDDKLLLDPLAHQMWHTRHVQRTGTAHTALHIFTMSPASWNSFEKYIPGKHFTWVNWKKISRVNKLASEKKMCKQKFEDNCVKEH
jgi:hypothetical protein